MPMFQRGCPAFFAERPPLKRARFTAFGMTKRSGRSAANDPALAMVLGGIGVAERLGVRRGG